MRILEHYIFACNCAHQKGNFQSAKLVIYHYVFPLHNFEVRDS